MTLQALDIEPFAGPLPDRVVDFIAAANRGVEDFVEGHLDEPITSFVPSNYEEVYRVLAALKERSVLSGRYFCEWGSGIGVVCGMASLLGFEACGIESRRELVEAGERFLSSFDIDIPLAQGTFIPPGADAVADDLDGPAWLDLGCVSGYDELESEIEDFDVIFAYPWPGEEHVVERLFSHFADIGAVLVTFRGLEGVIVQRKVARKN
ncbi:MAG: hypothetical protein V3W41_02140 [Planctomycetota bacterium]